MNILQTLKLITFIYLIIDVFSLNAQEIEKDLETSKNILLSWENFLKLRSNQAYSPSKSNQGSTIDNNVFMQNKPMTFGIDQSEIDSLYNNLQSPLAISQHNSTSLDLLTDSYKSNQVDKNSKYEVSLLFTTPIHPTNEPIIEYSHGFNDIFFGWYLPTGSREYDIKLFFSEIGFYYYVCPNDIDSLQDRSDYIKRCLDYNYLSPPSLSAIKKNLVLYEMLTQPHQWESILKRYRMDLNHDEKLALVAKIGELLNLTYNHERAALSMNEIKNTTVSAEALLNSITSHSPGGICTDIATFQANILKSFGFKDIFLVRYSSLDVGHVMILFKSHETKQIYRINYDEIHSPDKSLGASALITNDSIPSLGTHIRIHDGNGRAVRVINSDLGLFLREALNEAKDEYARGSQFQINKVSFKTPYGTANLFQGKTQTGDDLYGVSFNSALDYSNGLLKVGLAQSYGKKSNPYYGQINSSSQTLILSNENYIDIKDHNGSIVPFIGIELMLSFFDHRIPTVQEMYKSRDHSSTYYIGVRSHYQLKADTRWSNELKLKFENIAREISKQNYRLQPTLLELKTEIEWKNFISELSLHVSKIAPVVQAKLGMQFNQRHRLQAKAMQALKSDVPEFLPEARKASGVEYQYIHYKGIEIKIEIQNVSGQKNGSALFNKKF